MSGNIGDMAGIASIINDITSDPERMEKLRSAFNVSREDASAVPAEREESAAEVTDAPAAPAHSAPNSADRRRLVEALSPFLSPERRDKAQTLLTIMTLLESGSVLQRKAGD